MEKRTSTMKRTIHSCLLSKAGLILLAGSFLGSECRVESDSNRVVSKPQPAHEARSGPRPEQRRSPKHPSDKAEPASRNPCLDITSEAPSEGYSQSELDEMDCLCEKGHGRCCAMLGRSMHRLKGLESRERQEPRRKYMEKSCQRGYGVGCTEIVPEVVGIDRKKAMQAISLRFRQCVESDRLACRNFSIGISGIRGDPRITDRLRRWSCERGQASHCGSSFPDGSLFPEEALIYGDRACSIAASIWEREEYCRDSALERYKYAHPDVPYTEIKDQPDLPSYSFGSSVIYCSDRFTNPDWCTRVASLCRHAKFQHASKKKWCPKVFEGEARFLAAMKTPKKAGTDWPPDWSPKLPYPKKNLQMPSCERWRTRGEDAQSGMSRDGRVKGEQAQDVEPMDAVERQP